MFDDVKKYVQENVTDDVFNDFAAWVVGEEAERRKAAAVSAAAVAERENEIAREYLEANPPAVDEAVGVAKWVQPKGRFDAWPAGARVSHRGRVWVNILEGPATHEPGVLNSGWALDVEPGEPVPWEPGLKLVAGESIVERDGIRYDVLVDHVSHEGWVPGQDNGAVFQPRVEDAPHVDGEAGAGGSAAGEPDVKEFVQPTGAHDAYARGVRVLFEGKVYESLVDGNAFSPSAYPPNWSIVEG